MENTQSNAQKLGTVIRNKDFLGISFIILMAILPPLLGYFGWDFRIAYRGDTLNGTYGFNTWNPYPAYWLFFPFAILPIRMGMLLWNIVSACGFIFAIKQLKGSYLGFALSLPAFWTFYAGQIEGFIALGLGLALSTNPWIGGIGLLLLSFKPQVGLFAIIFVLWTKRKWQLLIAPGIVYGISLLVWGWWISDWLRGISSLSIFQSNLNISLFPWSLPLLLFLILYRDIRVWLIVQGLIMPYHTFYSLAPLLTSHINIIWINLMGWALFLGINFLNLNFYRPGIFIAFALFVIIIITVKRKE